jgi:hypothetical protein
MFRKAWEARSQSSKSESQRLTTKVRQIGRDVESLLKRLVETQNMSTISAYENRIGELEREKVVIKEEIARLTTPLQSFEEMFELSMQFLSSPYEIWKKGGLATKRTVLRLVYAAPLVVSRKWGVRTGETTYPFKALRYLKGTDSKMVPLIGT